MASAKFGTIITTCLTENDTLAKSWSCHRVSLPSASAESNWPVLLARLCLLWSLVEVQPLLPWGAGHFWLPNFGSRVPSLLHAPGELCVYPHLNSIS